VCSGQTYTGVAAGNEHSLAVTSEGQVLAWGLNNSGQTMVPAGDFHSLAVTSEGHVVAWGDNTSGQTNVPAPPAPPAGQAHTAIAAGGSHSIAVLPP
jgi:alpha-tubulin suppressor-like RCC1 family protein